MRRFWWLLALGLCAGAGAALAADLGIPLAGGQNAADQEESPAVSDNLGGAEVSGNATLSAGPDENAAEAADREQAAEAQSEKEDEAALEEISRDEAAAAAQAKAKPTPPAKKTKRK